MRKTRREKISILVWCVIPAVLVFGLTRSASRVWQDIQRTSSSAVWPSIVGQITYVIDPDSYLIHRYESDAILAFKYTVNGKEYTSSTISFSRRYKWYYSEIKEFTTPFRSHPSVRLFYDPQKPWIAVLQPGGSNSDNIWFFAGQCVAILLTSIFLVLMIWNACRVFFQIILVKRRKAVRVAQPQSKNAGHAG